MGDRTNGLRVGREVAGMAADAVAASLEDLVARLRTREAATDEDAPAGPAHPPTPVAPAGAARLPGPVTDALAAVIAEVLPAVLARLDVDAMLDRVDVQRIAARIDIDDLVTRIDIDAVVDRIDVDEVVRRIDLTAATAEALEAVDIGEVIRDSTATIGSDVVETLRAQAMRADDAVARVVDRLLGRRGPRRTAVGAAGRPR